MEENCTVIVSERVKRPAGRPTQYDPAYCQQIIGFFERAPADEYSSTPRELKDRLTIFSALARNAETNTLETAEGSRKEEVRFICSELPTIEAFARTIGVSSQNDFELVKTLPKLQRGSTDCQGYSVQPPNTKNAQRTLQCPRSNICRKECFVDARPIRNRCRSCDAHTSSRAAQRANGRS